MISCAKYVFPNKKCLQHKTQWREEIFVFFALNVKSRMLSSKPHFILEKQNIWVKTKHSYSRTKAEIRYAWILLRSQYIQKTRKKFVLIRFFLKILAGNSVLKFIGEIKTAIKHNLISDDSFESFMSLCMKMIIRNYNSE